MLPSIRKAVTTFLVFSILLFALAMLEKRHLIDSDLARRGMGLLVGVLMMTAGNYLPKSRPLRALRCSTASARAAERFAGWVLVAGGAVETIVFLFVPLAQARFISAYVGAGVVLAIACDWALLFLRSLRRQPGGAEQAESEPAAQGEREMLFLVLAVLCILVTAFLKLQWPEQVSSPVLATWIAILPAVVFAVVSPRSRRRCGNGSV